VGFASAGGVGAVIDKFTGESKIMEFRESKLVSLGVMFTI